MTLTREEAFGLVEFCVDNALCQRPISDMPDPPDNVSLVVWEPNMVVAVWSYLGGRLEDKEAEEIAIDLLDELSPGAMWNKPDYIL